MKFLACSLLVMTLIGCGGGGGDDDEDVVDCVTYDGTYVNATRCEVDRADPDTTDPDYQREFDEAIGNGGGTATPVMANRVESPFYR